MAYIDTTSDSYLFFVAKVRSLRGECTLRMSSSQELYQIVRWLVELDDEAEVTVDNDTGKEIYRLLQKRGCRVKPITKNK